MDDDLSVKKIGAWIPVTSEMRREAEEYRRWMNDPEYRAEQLALHQAQEAERRAAMARVQRWHEDHPNWWRRFWPWTVHRWNETCWGQRLADDD
jgi:hypothetical protein